MTAHARTALWPVLLALFSFLLSTAPVQGAEALQAGRTEFGVGESVKLKIPGVTGLIKPKWTASPPGIIDFDDRGRTEAEVKGLKPGTVTVSARVKGLFGSDTYSIILKVIEAGKSDRGGKDGAHTKIEGMAKVLGFPDKYARIARMLAEVNDGSRVPFEFYADLAKMGGNMFDVIAVRSNLVDGDPAFARDVLGPTFAGGGTDVEMRLLSWRRKETLAAIDEVVKRFVEAGRVPSDGYSLIISHVGKWATQDLSALTATGDIDFSFVSNDVALAEAMKAAFAEVIKRRTGLDPIALDSVATAHGKAGLEVYIGKHGMAFAEEQMKINELVDMRTGERRKRSLEEIAMGLTMERAMAETYGKEPPKPALNTEPGLSMEMVRHFGHDIVKTGIYDMSNAVVKAAKYLDRSYKSLADSGGTPADAELAAFAKQITEWANTKPQTPEIREQMVRRISEFLGSAPKVIFDQDTQKLVLALSPGQIAAFHKKATQAMWKTVEQGSNTRTQEIESRLRDLTERQRRGDHVDAEVNKLRQDMVELVDMVEAEIKAFDGADVPRVVVENNAKVRAMSNAMAGRFGTKVLSEEELKDKRFVEEMLKAEGKHSSEMRRQMTAAYIMERSLDALMKSPEIAMGGVEKTNQMLDFIDDGLLGSLRGETGFVDFEIEMKRIRATALDPKTRPGAMKELNALKSHVALGIKAANQKINANLQSTAAGRQGMKFMMVYGLVDEMQSYRDAFNQDGWGGFATEVFRRRIPLGSAVEGYMMGNTYRAGWDVITTLVPPLALPEAAWGLGRSLGNQAVDTYWSEQLNLFSDSLYDSAQFKLMETETHGDAKVGVYRLVSVKHRGIPIDLRKFAEMRKEQVEALGKQVGKGRLDWSAYKQEFQGLTNWMEVDALLQRNIAATDPFLLMLEDMIKHPSVVGSLQETRLAEKGLARWEEVKLGFITNLIKRLEDRKQAEQALGAGMLPDLFQELRKAAAELEIEDAMLRALDAEVNTNNLKALIKWMWEAKRDVMGQAPTESETSRAAQVVKKYLDTYKAIFKTRDALLASLPERVGLDGSTRWLTGDLFLSGRADADREAAEQWAKHVSAALSASREAVLAIKKEFLPNLGLEADDEAVAQRVFPRELWMKPYKDAGTARSSIALLDRAIDHGKARNAILDEYRKSLERQSPVQLTVTLVDAKDAKQAIGNASGDLQPTDELGKLVRTSSAGSQLVFGAPMGRYRLTVNAPGYEAASKDLTLGRGLNPTPRVTLSLTPAKDKKEAAGDDKTFMAGIDAALKARDWKTLADRLEATRKDLDLRNKHTERWDARMKALGDALRNLKDERMKWLLAWEPYMRSLEQVDNRAYASLLAEVEKQTTQFQNQCFERGSDPAHLRGERCRKEAYAYEEKCLPKAQRDAHWAEQKAIRSARNLLPHEVHLMHSTGFPTYQRWFEKVESLAKEHGLPFPYPEPVVTRLKYESKCAKLGDVKSTKKLDELTGLKVSLKGPTAPVPLGKPVTVTASASGGKGPYSYAWSGATGSGTRGTLTPAWAGDWTVSVTVRDSDGNGGEASVTVMVSPMKIRLAGAKGQVFYGSQAQLGTEGLGLPLPAPAADPCAGKAPSNNPFDPCNKVRIDPCNPMGPFCVDTTRSGTIDYTGGKGRSTPPTDDYQGPSIRDPAQEFTRPPVDAEAKQAKPQEQAAYRVIWQSDRNLTFTPPTSDDGTTKVTYDRMGEVKLWCELLKWEGGDYQTVGECEQETVTVVAPKFSVSFTPADGQARVGQEVRARINAQPGVPAKLIDYRWLDPATSNRMEYTENAGEIGFRVKDPSTLVLKALARVPFWGDEIGSIDTTYTGAIHEVKAWVVEPGTRPRMWDPKKGGLIPVPKGSYATFERIGLKAEVQGGPTEGVRWQWTVNEGTSISNPWSQTPSVSRSEAGGISARVVARDSNGSELGSAEVGLSVIEVSEQPPKPTPAQDKAEAQKLAELAEQQLKAGDIQAAANSVKQAMAHNASVATPTARKVADSAKKAGWQGVYERDFAKAIPHLETAHELNPGDRDAKEKLDKARRFAQVWPRVEEKAREFDAQMAEKKVWTAQKTMLQMQDLQHEMTGGMANPLSKRVSDAFNAGVAEYNVFMRQVEDTHRRTFVEKDWQAMLDNAEAALRRDHTPANEKMLRGNVDFARQMLREQVAKIAPKGVAGTWAINGNGYKGKLEINDQDGRLGGRVWYDAHGRWEELNDVGFDGRTLSFTRPIPGATQRYTGTFSGNEVKGNFTQQGTRTVYNWSAQMQEAAIPGNASVATNGVSLTLERTVFKPGETITVHFTALASWASNAWIGIIPSHIPHGEESVNDSHDVSYQHLKKRTSGSLTFKAPGEGDWDLRMHDMDNGGKEVASVSFKVGLDSSPAVDASNGLPLQVAGTWKTSIAELTLNQSGTQVSGTYKSDDGEIVGEMNGKVLEGYWIENNSNTRCATAKNGRQYWGSISWTFDGDRFTGAWSYCDKPIPASGNRWTGERIGASLPGAAPAPGVASSGGFIGCFKDQSKRDLNAYTFQSNRMTTAMCMEACSERGFAYAATQFATHCFCDNSHGQYGTATNCDMTCAGNAGEKCGGRWANSVYTTEVTPPPEGQSEMPATPSASFEIGNIGSVNNGPTQPTVFSLTEPRILALIQNYHWNHARGATPGTIGLRDAHGQLYGPWSTTGSPGQGGVPNAYWIARPMASLPAGHYTVVDSDPATWAQNSQSGGRGFTRVETLPVGSGTTAEMAGTWAINANGYIGKLEIRGQGGRLSGRVWYDAHARWEELEEVSFDGRTLSFTRPITNLTQRYTGTLSGNEFKGSFTQHGTSHIYSWSAQMKAPASPAAPIAIPASTAAPRPSSDADSLEESVKDLKKSLKELKGLFNW